MTFGFLIPSYVTSQESMESLHYCLRTLQEYHPSIPKILFVDPKNPIVIDNLSIIKDDPTIRIINTRYCDGELNVWKHFLHEKYFDVGILLHDSFLIKKPLENIEQISDVNFIWYFTNHRVHWDIIEEPNTEYNRSHKIRTHNDLIYHLAKQAYEGSDFFTWFQQVFPRKEEWIGCFGPVSIMRHEFLQRLQEKTGFLNIIPYIKDKRDRMAMESIYALACQYVLGRTADSYDGLYYDGIHPNNNYETDTFKKRIFYR